MGKKKKKLKDTEYLCSIDWLQLTFHELPLDKIFPILEEIGLGSSNSWQFVGKGLYGYKARYVLDSALLLFSPDGSRTDVHLSLPGSIVHRVDLLQLWKYSGHFTVSRIDFAYDVLNYPQDSFSPEYFFNLFEAGNVVTHLSFDSARLLTSSGGGQTAYFGSPQSCRMLRIYDKGIETGESKKKNEWIRFEFQVRHEMAEKLVGGNFIPTPDFICKALAFLMKDLVWFVKARVENNSYCCAEPDALWFFFYNKVLNKGCANGVPLLFNNFNSKSNFLRRKLEWFYKQASGTLAFIKKLFGDLDNFYANFQDTSSNKLAQFLHLNPEFSNVNISNGKFYMGDFELLFEDFCIDDLVFGG